MQDTWKCIVHVCHRTLYVWTALSRSCGQSAAWIKSIDKAPWSVIIYHSEFYQHVDSNLICGQVMSNLQTTLKINEFLLNRTHWVRQSPPISIFHLNNSPTAPPIDIDNHIQGINWSIVLEKVLIARASNVHLTNIEISGLGIFILRATMGFRQIMIWRSCINWLKNWLSALGVPQQQSMTGYPVARSVETEREKKREEVVVERERRVEVLVCPRKGQALSKWTKDESLSIQKEATIQVRFSITITAKSRVLLHQSASINHEQSIIWILQYVFLRPDMKLIAREAIRLPMARSFSVIKQPRRLPIQPPLPHQSHCIPDFLRLQFHACTTSSEFPRFLWGITQCNHGLTKAAGSPRRRECNS